jgi:hypothetical protein
MVNVTNGAYVHVGLGTCEFFFSHFQTPKSNAYKSRTKALPAKTTSTQTWCPLRESDPRPLPYQGSALPLSQKGKIQYNQSQQINRGAG